MKLLSKKKNIHAQACIQVYIYIYIFIYEDIYIYIYEDIYVKIYSHVYQPAQVDDPISEHSGSTGGIDDDMVNGEKAVADAPKATSSSTGRGGRRAGGGLSQAALQLRRRAACEELDRGIRALEAKDPKVRELMENTEKFVTTPTIGNDLVTVLLYPPTECRKSGRSFG